MISIEMPTSSPSIPSRLGLARLRKPVSRVLAAGLLTVIFLTNSVPAPVGHVVMEIAGILLIAVGMLGRVWCAIYIAGRKNSELCQDGPYSLCRNPLYLFSFLALIGLVLAARLGVIALIIAPLFWAYHHFVIRAEEAALRALFGSAYEEYCQSVPRVWPSVRRYWSRPHLTTNPRLLARNLLEVGWFLVALAMLEIVEHGRGVVPLGLTMPTALTLPF